jgi:hypothetical protein
MASTYPTSLDSFTNPSASSLLTSPSHAQQHADINDAMEAVQTKLAIGNTVIGTYTAYTPTFVSGVTVGNGVFTAQYGRVNDFVHYYGKFVFGSTSAITGAVTLSLPIAVSTGFVSTNVFGNTILQDVSSGVLYNGVARGATLSTTVALKCFAAYSTYAFEASISSTVPMTWASPDIMFWNLYYEAA